MITGCVADYDDGVTNNDDGSGGNAPCLKNFIGGFDYSTLGDDPHAVMGLEANDGGYVAIGSGLYSEGSKPSQGFIMKTSGSCTYTDYEYITLSSSETDCDKTWDWVSTFGTAGGKNAALWVAESIDNTYFIVVGIHS